jgi:hypothetical protein
MGMRHIVAVAALSLTALSLRPERLAGQSLGPFPSPTPDTTRRAIPVQAQRPAAPAAAQLMFMQWRGQYGGGDLSTQVATSSERWSRMWGMVGQETPRALDATREMGVYVAIGERPTGGYRVEVLRATEQGDALVVEYSVGAPGDRVVTQAFTSPWVIAVLPRSSLPVRFRRVD